MMRTKKPGASLSPDNPLGRHRRRLASHIFVLVSLCVLPLAGLALYFLSTGLHREIAVADRERSGLNHVRQIVLVLNHAVRLSWSETGDDKKVAILDHAISTLDQVELSLASVAPPLASDDSAAGAFTRSNAKIRSLWREVKVTESGTDARTAALQQLVSQLHENIFQITDESGLSAGPESEISALTTVVAVRFPTYVERLLHMHERMADDLREKGWDPATTEAAHIFVRQIEQEDLKRLDRSIASALQSDLRSAHVLVSFQRDYRLQAEALLASLQRLAVALRPLEDEGKPNLTAEEFDRALHGAFDAAMIGWGDSVRQLDALVGDQIAEAQSRRDAALGLAAVVAAALVPVVWFYFRSFIRPVVEAMVATTLQSQQAAEHALAEADESTRRLKQTQAALDDHCAVVVLNDQDRIVAVNDRMCRMSGYGREELLDHPFPFAGVRGSDCQAPQDITVAMAKGATWHGNLSQRTKDGRLCWVDVTMFPFRDHQGVAVEFVMIQTDITELVAAREQAESAVRAKGQFLAMMSHEIRTPMNGVIGFAQLLAETPLDDQQRDYARTILTSGESLLVIINDILDFSKLEAGKTELESRPIAVRALVEDVLDLMTTAARAKNLELVYHIEADVPDGMLGDATRLRQVLLNLAGNAVKFTARGYVEIGVALAAGGGPPKIDFHVRDTGIGIPAAQQDRLFRAFSQVDASTTRKFGGTGLGLAISQRLVQLMGGEVAVKSIPGEGSDFHFSLPLIQADVSAAIHAGMTGDRDTLEQVLRRRQVLVVDDLSPNRKLFEAIFARYGAEVAAVNSADAALGVIDAQRFDLIVLDYLMPAMDGVTLARTIKTRMRDSTPPMIMVTSAQPEDAKKTGLFFAVLSKPLRTETLAVTAMRALRPAVPASEKSTVRKASAGTFALEHPLKILLVDDNPVNLKVIAATLTSLGYAPLTFDNATAALAQLGKEKFDLVLTDVQMPGLDGHEATRLLRSGMAGELNRFTRVVALTAGAMAEERAACLAAGMDDFIAKPVMRSELLEKLAAAAQFGGRKD